jgi:hypothetical protein
MTNDKQQSAVDWQFDQLSSENLLGVFTYDQMTRVMEILEQAKEMEKEQIINANRDGVDMVVDKKDFISGEQYYNKTFNTNEK